MRRWEACVILSAEESLAILEEKGVPSGLIYSAKEMVNDQQFQAREMIVNVEHEAFGEFPMPGVVPKLSRTPGGIRFPGSTKVGQHNEEVYRNLIQLTKEQLEQLASRGIV